VDYLKTIAVLHTAEGEARVVDLARRLSISHVTVVRTLKRLERDGFITKLARRSIFLTEEGRRVAEAAQKRFDFIVRFLQSIGVPEMTARADADGTEHHASATTIAALKRLLDAQLRSRGYETK
jgi:DtxR family manganese transport transcriptional regulator